MTPPKTSGNDLAHLKNPRVTVGLSHMTAAARSILLSRSPVLDTSVLLYCVESERAGSVYENSGGLDDGSTPIGLLQRLAAPNFEPSYT
ncbi:MAG: hypothetical protein ACRDPA_01640, partial [Solirubrobacteraceae bacterium]